MEEKPEININNKSFKPMVIAQRCPVCNGFGTVGYGRKDCQACGTKGYILVPTVETKKEDMKDGEII